MNVKTTNSIYCRSLRVTKNRIISSKHRVLFDFGFLQSVMQEWSFSYDIVSHGHLKVGSKPAF